MTAGQETYLSLSPEKTKLRANGQDLCYIPIEFTDGNGFLEPWIEHKITLTVHGAAARLAGFGSALCKTDEIFDKAYHDSYRGRALAVLRAGTQPGRVTFTAESAGVKPVTVEIEVQK